MDDIMPSQLLKLERKKVLGIILEKGSINSHSSILTRSFNIPSIINVGNNINQIKDRNTVILDGINNSIILNPNTKTIKQYELLIKKYQNEQKSLLAYKGIETKINDKKIILYANIGSILELDFAIENDAQGIG